MKKFTKTKKLILVGSTLCMLSISVIATPVLTTIQARLNTTPIYTLDNKKIMEGAHAIDYSNKIYVPVEDLAATLGLELSYKENTIALSTPSSAPKNITIENATIKKVNESNGQITVLPTGLQDTQSNYITLNISKDTILSHANLKKIATFKDLKEGHNIKVVHSPYMTKSIPPQTNAFEITLLDNAEAPKDITIERATIKKVDAKNNQVTILPEGQPDSYEYYVVLNVSKDTAIQHEKTKKIYSLNDLTSGLTVKIVHAPFMTASLPPQTSAYKITIIEDTNSGTINKPDSSVSKLEDVTIQSVNHAEKYLIVKDKNNLLTQVPFTNKIKVEWDNHKKPNVNSLKKGQKIDIKLQKGIATEIEIDD
ncbi:MAG: hypothetical protein AB9856_00750 [Cellulosilyticaceae bacterium]